MLTRYSFQKPLCGVGLRSWELPEAPQILQMATWMWYGGQLKSHEVYVPRKRVRESLMRVCPEAVENPCRVYNVPSSNALWHIDGLSDGG